MKIDNIDINKLKLADVPKFEQCPCELCDDGCFDQAGHQHYPGCRRRFPAGRKTMKSAQFPSTHYRSTYLAGEMNNHGAGDRQMPCPPPRDNHIPISFKNAPMEGLSSQRQDYKAPPSGTLRQSMIYPSRVSESADLSRSIPMETRSLYQVEYVEKSALPTTVHMNNDSQINLTEPTAPMNSQTITRTHFKSWKSSPAYPYTEMPSVAGHVMFPGANRSFDTTNGSNFVSYDDVSKIKSVNRMEPTGNLTVSGGSMDLRTNYRVDYIPPDPKQKKTEKKIAGEPKVFYKPPMKSISQTTFDYRAYPSQQRRSLLNNEQFQSQINLGSSLTNVKPDSQYRLDYAGHDTNEHRPQPPAIPKGERQPYVPPNIKMDTVTINQRDFQPIDLNALPKMRVVPVKSSLSLHEHAPMENMTTTRSHFQAYEPVGGNRRFGELVSNLYISPSDKFYSTTTTGETFQGRSGLPARPIINEMQSIGPFGKQDHRTNYRVDYQPHGLSLCAAKAFNIAKKKETTKSIEAQ